MTDPICIVYFSGSGHTACLARVIGDGIADRNAVARLIDVSKIEPADWAALDAAPGIVFGAPTYMGSTAAQFDVFLEEASSRWLDMVWQDKIAAGFTVASHPSGDKWGALVRMSVYAAQMGMIWVGQAETGAPVHPDRPGVNRDGSWLGLMATSSRDKSELIETCDRGTARQFGVRIAGAVERWGAPSN